MNSAQLSTHRPPRAFNRLIANAAVVATTSVMTPTATAMSSEIAELQPEMTEEVMLFAKDRAEVAQRRMVGPELARERVFLGGN